MYQKKKEGALTGSEIAQWTLMFRFHLRWKTRPFPFHPLFFSEPLPALLSGFACRLPQRLPHCGSPCNLSLTAPIVVRFSIRPCVSQHPQSRCLVIVARLPNVDRLVNCYRLPAQNLYLDALVNGLADCAEVVKVKMRALSGTTDLLLILNQVRARIILS